MAPALSAFRETLSGDGLLQFDSKVTVEVGTDRRKVRLWGLPISKEKWQLARNRRAGKAVSAKSARGRPSKVEDPALIQKVVACIKTHSQESSVWLKKQNCHARTLTTSLLRAYWDEGLVTSLAWSQFHKIVRQHCKWAVRPSRKTDYCDYCHLLQTSLRPGLRQLLREAETSLTTIMPSYFGAQSELLRGEEISACEALSRCIRTHSEDRRQDRRRELRVKAQQDLHEMEAKIAHRLNWELQVAKSYQWHWLVAKRQARSLQVELENLSQEQVLLWSDYKQNLTVPLAHTETGDMFYGASRMEMTCWGCLVFQRRGGKLTTKHIIVLSSIIEHTVLVSNLLYAEVAKHIPDLAGVSEVLVWSDCGPHYKGYDHVAGWIGEWVEASVPRKVRLSYFGEKHGKGQVDGLFGQIEGWLKDYFKTPKRRIATIDEMETVLRSAATQAMATDPTVQYAVVRWEPEQKPASAWVLPGAEFKISKTYCLQLLPDNPRVHVRTTSILDYTFTELAGQPGGSRSYPKVELEAVADRAWRRGYFSAKPWDRKAPEQARPDSIVKRHQEHKRRRLQPPNLEDEFERTARRQADKLLRRREKWSRMKGTVEGEPSSSSSSSSSTSSSSASGPGH